MENGYDSNNNKSKSLGKVKLAELGNYLKNLDSALKYQ